MKDIQKILSEPNIIVYFYMNGCPYCIKTQPIWNQLKKTKLSKKFKFADIEKSELPEFIRQQKSIQGFPHFIIRNQGNELSSPGSKNTLSELMNSLHVRRLGRSNTRKLTRRIRKRT
jgi:glutaredoxin